ncbi:MAG: hypothetical protein OXE57_18415 [Alphaproteobacteria bacterium]|nr:hypothetical protein [Alphaproteobacteria bacterium]
MIATIVVGLLTCAVTVGIYIFQSPGKEIGTQVINSEKPSKKPSPDISISSIHISSVAMDVPAAFEMELEVDGSASEPAKDIIITLDFGRSEIRECGYVPRQNIKTLMEEGKNYRRLKIVEIQQDEKFYIRCIVSQPIFDRVAIGGGNLLSTRSITFSQYLDMDMDGSIGFWGGLFRAFVIFLSVMLCFKIVGFLFPNL